jgi:hypothetical protein
LRGPPKAVEKIFMKKSWNATACCRKILFREKNGGKIFSWGIQYRSDRSCIFHETRYCTLIFRVFNKFCAELPKDILCVPERGMKYNIREM